MKPCFIYFKEMALSDDIKFALDFSDQGLVQEIGFLSKNDCYITSLNYNLMVKKHIHDDKKKKIEELSEKSRLLLEKGAVYLNDIAYLLLKTLWYVNDMIYTYCFKLFPKIFPQYS